MPARKRKKLTKAQRSAAAKRGARTRARNKAKRRAAAKRGAAKRRRRRSR